MDTSTLASILPDTAHIGPSDIVIGGCSLSDLAREHGTPLYVYDENTLKRSAEAALERFSTLRTRVSFAAKACSVLGVLRVFSRAGLGLDVVSGGELLAGLRAGFPAERIHMHGNFKSRDEIREAVLQRIHAIVVDNLQELREIDEICQELRMPARVMLRLALDLEADTHPALMTAGRYSKFGLSEEEEQSALAVLKGNVRLRLIGLHAHLGSQISDEDIYRRASVQLARRAGDLLRSDFSLEEVSVGGGWAVPYRPSDPQLGAEAVAEAVEPALRPYPALRVAVEPGRALVARAAVALYTAGSVKGGSGGRIISVDGGMGDNPRPALYGARYTALAINGACRAPEGSADIVGRYCESGDVVAREVCLPSVEPGDLIAVPVSGAYHLSMVSAYNMVPPPAVVMVRAGRSVLLSRRGTVDDLMTREQPAD